MTEQIEGIPLALVQQGWRRVPSTTVHDEWSQKNGRWQWCTLWNSDIRIARPVTVISEHASADIVVYNHGGWGEGLAPTAETVQVWTHWWLASADGPGQIFVIEAIAYKDGSLTFRGVGEILTIEEIHSMGAWLGPVLPPVTLLPLVLN